MKRHWLFITLLLCSAPGLLAQNPQLKQLQEEDQATRMVPPKVVSRSDEDRIKLVSELLAQGTAKTPEDKFNASVVLQHTALDFCGSRMVSKSATSICWPTIWQNRLTRAGIRTPRSGSR